MDREQVNRYISSLYANERDLEIAETPKWGFGEDVPGIDPDVAGLLRFLIELLQAREILEIGTDIGYSTIAMAKTVRSIEGRITTIEFDRNAAREARVNFEREGVSSLVQLMEGEPAKVLPRLAGGYDLVFLAVDKSQYGRFLDECVRLLKPGGVLITSDTLFPVAFATEEWEQVSAPVHEFNRRVAQHAELHSTMIPVGGGVTIAMKVGGRAA